MAGNIREMSSEMGDNHGNFDLFRLDSSVRIKTRICAEVTYNRICANAHNLQSLILLIRLLFILKIIFYE